MRLQQPRAHACPVDLLRVDEEAVAGIRMRADRRFTRVRHGVYTWAADWAVLPPWDRYLARVHAYALVRPDAVFSYESAAALTGLPLFGEPRDIHITDTRRTSSTRFGDVCVHTTDQPRAPSSIAGLATTTVADTVLDLVRVLPPAFGLAVADAALRQAELRDASALAQVAAHARGRQGRARAVWVLERADALVESPAESVSRAVIEWWGFERPELQTIFRYEGVTDRADFYWRRVHLIGECDGDAKYDDADPREVKRRVMAEKTRENRLRRHDNGMTRWGWSEALQAQPLRDRLLLAGLTPVQRPQPAMLATLRSHPRSYKPGTGAGTSTGDVRFR